MCALGYVYPKFSVLLLVQAEFILSKRYRCPSGGASYRLDLGEALLEGEPGHKMYPPSGD